MSSWKKFFKARTHQERPQPQSREKLGILEKPKDYLVRRKNFRRKQDMLLNLMKKAALKNPDEFYNKMISDKNKSHTKNTKSKLLEDYASNFDFLNLKKQERLKRADKINSDIATFQSVPTKKHVVFLEEEVQNFDLAEHFDTVPELMSNSSNRLRKNQLEEENFLTGSTDIEDIKQIKFEQSKVVYELKQSRDEASSINNIMEHINLQKNLLNKGRRIKIADGDGKTPPIYKWKKQRSR